ncbi:MAG: molybdenum cofactor sulfurase [Chloroflexi bacterium RBG_13_51_18]|nr:MAG: molybdenum cofactor sulfurase [Chloroflexi bacterium RBG_13_51_18]
MPSVIAVCTSEKKGTVKTPVDEIVIQENLGVVGDAHADGTTHRQISLLAMESIDKMRGKGIELKSGDFAENITTRDINLVSLPIGTRLNVGKEVVLEMTQIGKECHADCAIRKLVGDCIMPREGVFAKVIRGGRVKPGDAIKITKKKQ